MRVPVCFSACFCGLNPRTVPQLSLNKFRASLGYRGLVLELNVRVLFLLFFGYFEWNTCRAKLDRAEVADIITSQEIAGSAGPSWETFFCACSFLCFFSRLFSRHFLTPPPPPPSIVQCRVVLCINVHHRS